MRFAFTTTIFLITYLQLFSQKDSTKFICMMPIEEPASYPGGHQAMTKFLYDKLEYPAEAERHCISGQVVVSYCIDKTGNVFDIKLEQSVCEELDREAIRVIKLLKDFRPAARNGRNIKCYHRQPFTFIYEQTTTEPIIVSPGYL